MDELLANGAVDTQGNVVLVGVQGEHIGHIYDAFIMKVRPDGSYLTRCFVKEDTVSFFTSVTVLDNGNYFVTGAYSPSGLFDYSNHLWILILGRELDVIDEKAYPVDTAYIGFGPQMQTVIDNNGNIAMAGHAKRLINPNQFRTDFAFYKCTQQGDTLLSRYYYTLMNSTPYHLRKMPGSDKLMLIGQSFNVYQQPELSFLDSDMNVLYWRLFNPYQNFGFSFLRSDLWLNQSEFLMSARNFWTIGNQIEHYIGVYRVDTLGQILDELALDRPDTLDCVAWRKSMAYANDSTIFIGGFQSYNAIWHTTPNLVYFYLIDRDMNLLGQKDFFPGDAHYQPWGILSTPDNGCLMWGQIYRNPHGILERDIFVWKILREEIDLITSVETIDPPPKHSKAWPNPVNDVFFVSLDGINAMQGIRLQIYDMKGVKISERHFKDNGNVLRINVNNLAPGTYIYNISTGNGKVIDGKFVKQ
ncbi:MAG TPA: T9SS type A sorting domain-containing protein [Bacteroidales bacterium]|nr:T9SS type A sorting domain-containing protein [Bacteroidales bacterium]